MKKIIVFTRNGEKIPKIPERPGLAFQHIRFDSVKLDDLMLIARYRIVNFPTSIIINGNGKILLRVKGSIPGSYVDNV